MRTYSDERPKAFLMKIIKKSNIKMQNDKSKFKECERLFDA